MRNRWLIVSALMLGCGRPSSKVEHAPAPVATAAATAPAEDPPRRGPQPGATKLLTYKTFCGHWCTCAHAADIWSDGTVERTSNDIHGWLQLSSDEVRYVSDHLGVFELCRGKGKCGPNVDDAGSVEISIFEGDDLPGRAFHYHPTYAEGEAQYAPAEVESFGDYLDELTKPSDFWDECKRRMSRSHR